MAAAAGARRRTPPAPRGKPYWDADRGQRMIVPPGGGKAVPYIGPKERQGFDARQVLRQTGVRARDEARASGRTARRAARATPAVSPSPGFGSLLVYLVGSIVGLALLDALVSGRGPAAYGKTLGGLGRGFQKLVDPRDPLFGASHPDAGSDPALIGPAPGLPSGGLGGGVGGATAGSPQRARARPKLGLVPGDVAARAGIQLDQRVLAEAVAIARQFGAKISSGYRTPAQNRAVGGADDSGHLRGDAADYTSTSPAVLRALYAWAVKQHFPYVEPLSQSKDHVHISFIR